MQITRNNHYGTHYVFYCAWLTKRLIPGHQLHAIYFDIRFQEQADDEKDLDKTFSLNQAEYVTRAGVKTK